MAHPIAPDDRFTYEQNMQHILDMMQFFYVECGIRVIAPYHTMCLVLPDDQPEFRRIGLEVDLVVVRALGRLILAGHKISSGMKDELVAVCESYQGGIVHNFTGWTRPQIKQYFDKHREWQTTAIEHRNIINTPNGHRRGIYGDSINNPLPAKV